MLLGTLTHINRVQAGNITQELEERNTRKKTSSTATHMGRKKTGSLQGGDKLATTTQTGTARGSQAFSLETGILQN